MTPYVPLKDERLVAPSRPTPEVLKAGVVAGLIGGLFMAVLGMASTWAMRLGLFTVPQLIGASFQGPEALLRGAWPVAFGVLLHLIVSVVFGVVFATVVRRDTPRGAATVGGVAFALGIFVLMTFVVVPVVNPVMANRVSMMVGTFLMMHVVYGLGLSLAPALRRSFAKAPPLSRTPSRVTLSMR